MSTTVDSVKLLAFVAGERGSTLMLFHVRNLIKTGGFENKEQLHEAASEAYNLGADRNFIR